MSSIIIITQFFFTIVIGMYFLTRMKNEKTDTRTIGENSKKDAERLNQMRHISLTEPMTEAVRPKNMSEVIGQEDGIKALKAAQKTNKYVKVQFGDKLSPFIIKAKCGETNNWQVVLPARGAEE